MRQLSSIGSSLVCLVLLGGLVAGCVSTTSSSAPTAAPAARQQAANISHSQARSRLAPITARVEPVAERECRARTNSGTDCDYLISVDSRTELAANAYQTVDKNGRPLIVFTTALIAQTGNADELAFVMGHEAAHHIAGHLTRQQNNAMTGAALSGILVAALGGNADAVEAAMDLGAGVGARSYSKNFELEADALGTVIAHKAGYDPVRGAEFFNRIADPGDRFLGTHPPNAARMEIVRRTAAGL